MNNQILTFVFGLLTKHPELLNGLVKALYEETTADPQFLVKIVQDAASGKIADAAKTLLGIFPKHQDLLTSAISALLSEFASNPAIVFELISLLTKKK